MQLQCWHCAKTVSNHVPDSTVFRATATCPECEQKKTSPEPSRKPEGDAGQSESNALRAAVHRRALESQRAEGAEEQVRQLTAKLASRAEAERELEMAIEACATRLESDLRYSAISGPMKEIADHLRAAVAKYQEAK